MTKMAVNSTAAEVIIIGAGLTGLTLAKNLQEQDKSFIILEARDRIGGRIHMVKVNIIGAGLTGLTLAKNLKEQDKSVIILEARDRIGGRIHMVKTENGPKVELGATWFFPHFETLFSMKKVKVSLKEQYMKSHTLYDSGKGTKLRKIWSGACLF